MNQLLLNRRLYNKRHRQELGEKKIRAKIGYNYDLFTELFSKLLLQLKTINIYWKRDRANEQTSDLVAHSVEQSSHHHHHLSNTFCWNTIFSSFSSLICLREFGVELSETTFLWFKLIVWDSCYFPRPFLYIFTIWWFCEER